MTNSEQSRDEALWTGDLGLAVLPWSASVAVWKLTWAPCFSYCLKGVSSVSESEDLPALATQTPV